MVIVDFGAKGILPQWSMLLLCRLFQEVDLEVVELFVRFGVDYFLMVC